MQADCAQSLHPGAPLSMGGSLNSAEAVFTPLSWIATAATPATAICCQLGRALAERRERDYPPRNRQQESTTPAPEHTNEQREARAGAIVALRMISD